MTNRKAWQLVIVFLVAMLTLGYLSGCVSVKTKNSSINKDKVAAKDPQDVLLEAMNVQKTQPFTGTEQGQKVNTIDPALLEGLTPRQKARVIKKYIKANRGPRVVKIKDKSYSDSSVNIDNSVDNSGKKKDKSDHSEKLKGQNAIKGDGNTATSAKSDKSLLWAIVVLILSVTGFCLWKFK